MRSLITGRLEWIVILSAAALKLWLVATRPVEVLDWTAYDDLWFLRAAEHILAGRWMGPYGELTLIKGVGYPLWIAAMARLGIPLLLSQQLLYAAACLLLYRALAPALASAPWRAALFTLVLFNPITFANGVSTRVLREGIYPALSLLVCAGIAGTLVRLANGRRRKAMLWAVMTGVAIAMFWHTREEGLWLAPMLGVGAFVTIGWAARARAARRADALLVLVIPLVVCALAWAAIAGTNQAKYGVLATCEFKEPSFTRAYGALTHVRKQHPVPRNPVPREVRERVYSVSPAFAELRPYLEGPLGRHWIELATEQAENDFGGLFMWAFRQAVTAAGYYDRGSAAVRAYYDRVSQEIAEARRTGQLEGEPGPASLTPAIGRESYAPILRAWLRGLISVVRFSDFSVSPAVSEHGMAQARIYTALTKTRLAPAVRMKKRLVGWIVHVSGAVDLRIEDASGRPSPGSIVKRTPSPGLYQHLARSWKPFAPARQAGFDITSDEKGAFLVVSLKGTVIDRLDLGETVLIPSDPGIRMSVDRIDMIQPVPGKADGTQRRILHGIGRAYQTGFPIVLILAVAFYTVRAFTHPRAYVSSITFAVVVGLFCAVAARVLILAAIDVTTFPVFNVLYQSPSHALVLAATVLLAHDAVNAPALSWWARTGSSDRSDGSGT